MKILIADDNKASMARLRKIIQAIKPKAKIHTVHDGHKALTTIEKLKPDIVFLDIEMPKLTGIEVANSLVDHKPPIIFTTAHSQYAVDAFKLSAIDYLLKPVELDTVTKSFLKLEKNIISPFSHHHFAHEQIAFRSNYRYKIYKYTNIIYIEGSGKSTNLIHVEGIDRINSNLEEVETKLPKNLFMRIHRSYIINRQYLKEIYVDDDRKHIALIKLGKKLISIPIGKTKIKKIKELME